MYVCMYTLVVSLVTFRKKLLLRFQSIKTENGQYFFVQCIATFKSADSDRYFYERGVSCGSENVNTHQKIIKSCYPPT